MTVVEEEAERKASQNIIQIDSSKTKMRRKLLCCFNKKSNIVVEIQ